MKLEELFIKYKNITSLSKEVDEDGVLNSLMVLNMDDDWVLPETANENYSLSKDEKALVVYTKNDMDDLLNYVVKEIINYNVELLNKKELFNNKIKEMEELFNNKKFDELKNIVINIG
jgi:hypothetical protein